jgi:hypothetical protein
MSVEIREEIRDVLDSAMSKVNEDGAESILILLKSDGRYVRYSTSIDDVASVLGQLEIIKADVLRRMQG